MRAAMQYRLRTLLIGAFLGPPLLALLWFGAIWARHSLSPLLLELVKVANRRASLAYVVTVVSRSGSLLAFAGLWWLGALLR